jgi:putative peptidoglycan lipid II flippase
VVAGLFWAYGEQRENALALGLTALMLPYLVFICAAAMLGGLQNVFGHFATAAAAPVIMNVFMIAATLGGQWLSWSETRAIVMLGAAVVASGVVQMAWQWAGVRRMGLRLPLRNPPRPPLGKGGRADSSLPPLVNGGRAEEAPLAQGTIDAGDAALRRIGVTMLPMIAGLATVQINTLVGSLMAWWFVPEEVLRAGAEAEKVGPAVLSLAQRLYQFPLGIFATALATAIFPALSQHAAERDLAGLGKTLSRGLRTVSFEGLPSMVGLILIRAPLVQLLFGHGEFREWPEATGRVSFALYMYALGIWAFGVNQIVVRAFYAIGDARTPLRVSMWNVVLSLALNLVLVQTSLREAGLALATSICAVVQVVELMWRFSRRVGYVEWTATMASVARTVGATGVMAMAVLGASSLLGAAQPPAIRVGVLVAVGGLGFLAAARVLRCTELSEIARK